MQVKSIVLTPKTAPKVFAVLDSGAEARFKKMVSQRDDDTKFAFHGTRFYNVFSILNLGLQQHLNKQALFGEGLYFAQELGEFNSSI